MLEAKIIQSLEDSSSTLLPPPLLLLDPLRGGMGGGAGNSSDAKVAAESFFFVDTPCSSIALLACLVEASAGKEAVVAAVAGVA